MTDDKKIVQSGYSAFSRSTLVNAVCSIMILAWALMINLSMIARTEIMKGSAGAFWDLIGRLASPPVKLWSLLLIPSSLAVALILFFDKDGKLLKWYIIGAAIVILMIGFALLRVMIWGFPAFPLMKAL